MLAGQRREGALAPVFVGGEASEEEMVVLDGLSEAASGVGETASGVKPLRG